MKRSILVLAIGALLFTACSKTQTSPTTTTTTTTTTSTGVSAAPFATLKNGRDKADLGIWTYTSADSKLTRVKWEDIHGGVVTGTESDMTNFTYEGGKLVKFESLPTGIGKVSYVVTYDGDKIKKITEQQDGSTSVFTYMPEYDSQGRVAQWNLDNYISGTLAPTYSFQYSFTYDASGNIIKNVFTQGTRKTTFTYKYDTKENKFYNNNYIILMSLTNRYGNLGTSWFNLLGYSKNNMIESNADSGQILGLTYTFDTNGYIIRTDMTNSLSPGVNNYWIINY